MDTIWRNIVYSLRGLCKTPGFTVISVLILALCIGSNSALFSLADAVMLRSLPIRDPHRLVLLEWTARHGPNTHDSHFWSGCPKKTGDSKAPIVSGCVFSYPMFEHFHTGQNVFSSMAAFAGPTRLTASISGNTSAVGAEFVSGEFFSMLGIQATVGRPIEPGDDQLAASPSIVLAYGYWSREFAADPLVLGKSIYLNGVSFTVVGVAPPEFMGLEPGVPRDVWVPLAFQPKVVPDWPKPTEANSLWIEMLGRLKPGVKASQAEAALSLMFGETVTGNSDPIFKSGDSPRLLLEDISLGLTTLRDEFAKPLSILAIGVTIILLIACANIAGLMLTRAAARRKEIAVRYALGATNSKIVFQLLTEGLLLSLSGGGLGVLLAYWGARFVAVFLSTNFYMPLQIDVRLDLRMLTFTLAVSILTGILLTLAPSLQRWRADLTPALKEQESVSPVLYHRSSRYGFGRMLVVAQVSLATLVLVGAGLMVRTLVNLRTVSIGFDRHNLLLFRIDALNSGYRDSKTHDLYREMQNQLSSLPGVRSVSYSAMALLSSSNMTSVFEALDSSRKVIIPSDMLPVGPTFFETMGIALLAGRTFTPQDSVSLAKPEPAVVNETLARRMFGNANPLGQRFRESGSSSVDYITVGVVADTKYDELRRAVQPTAYFPLKEGDVVFELKTAGDAHLLIPTVRSKVNELDSNLALFDIRTQVEQIDKILYQERLNASLSAFLSLLALVLACLGLYGLLSYQVRCRTREIGTRIALGAEPGDVLALVIKEGVGLTCLGALVGIVGAATLTRYLSSLLYGIRPTDPLTFVVVAGLFMMVATLACHIPARRASKLDPMTALRCE